MDELPTSLVSSEEWKRITHQIKAKRMTSDTMSDLLSDDDDDDDDDA